MSLISVAWSATYSFYFNNTEQGPNSTATPSITVDGVKATGTGAQQTVSSNGTVLTGLAPVSPADTAPAASIANAPAVPSSGFKRFRVILGTTTLSRYGIGGLLKRVGGSFEAGFWIGKDLGIHVLGGGVSESTYGLAEIEIVPLRLTLFRFENLIELGVLAGGHTDSPYMDWPRYLHAGARLNLNLGDSWSLTTSLRLSPGASIADAGLAMHF